MIDDYRRILFDTLLKGWGGPSKKHDDTLVLMHTTRPEMVTVNVDMLGDNMVVVVVCGVASAVFNAHDLQTRREGDLLIMQDQSSLLFLLPND